ncbi:MAG TPA: delta-60 repeat domain-containing protein [Pyrinomonadaceae bacterium]|nr:delta-60 repeat domain-containing protein [Pyrinomonadaceae bacterium]
MASYEFGGSDNTVNCVALQRDGKIVVGGGIANGFGLARFQSDGSLDTTFGSGGVVTTRLPGPLGYNVGAVEAVALLPDGKIVVAGTSISNYAYNTDFVVARYNVDGSPDATFGDGGITVTDFFGEYDLAHAVAVQGDGKIIVAGAANRDGGTRASFAVARYGVDGSLDAGFGVGGKVVADSFDTLKWANAVGVQPDGKIVVAGYGEFNQAGGFALARLGPDGSPDLTFGLGGVTLTEFHEGSAEATALTLQPDGRIVAAGYVNNRPGTSSDFAVARYDGRGLLDGSFGKAGRATIDFRGDFDLAFAVAALPDGGVVLAGYAQMGVDDSDFAVAKVDRDGKWDRDFGNGGRVMTDFYGLPDVARAVAVRPDGRIVAAGYTSTGGTIDFALACYVGASK